MKIEKPIVRELSLQLRKDGLVYDFARKEVFAFTEGEAEVLMRFIAISDDRAYIHIPVDDSLIEKYIDQEDLRRIRHLIEESHDISLEEMILSSDLEELEKVEKLLEQSSKKSNIIQMKEYMRGLR